MNGNLARIALVALVALAFGAGCPDLKHQRMYPRWVVSVADPAEITWRDCAGVRGVVRRSGKAGLAMVLELRSRHDCPMSFARAEIVFDDGTRAAARAPALPPMRGRSLIFTWMPVPFDGDALWNRGVRRGRIELDLLIGDTRHEAITWPLVQLFEGPFWGDQGGAR